MGTIIISKNRRVHLPKIGDIISFLMVSSLFLSIDGVLMLCLSSLLFGVALKPILLCAMFLAVYSVYSLNRLTDQEEDAINAPERSTFVAGNERFLLAIAVVSYIAALVLGWIESPFAALVLLFPIISGIAYSKNIFSAFGIPRLKDIFLVKSLIVASSWAVCAAFLPMIYLSGNFTKLGFIFPFFFIKMFINTVLFDVRDVVGDALNDVKTIPVVIGIKKTRQFLLILQSSILVWLALFLDSFSRYYVILIISMIYGYLYIIYFCCENEHNGVLRDVLVDGEWIITGVLVWIYSGIDSYLALI